MFVRGVLIAACLWPAVAAASEIRVRVLRHAHELELVAEHGRAMIGETEFSFNSAQIMMTARYWRVIVDGVRKRFPLRSMDIHADQIKMNAVLSPPDIEIKLRLDNTVDVIARLPLEEYLRGVVPSEMPPSWPAEALKAQAIAARSYAYHRVLERRDLDFDVESDIADQKFMYAPTYSTEKSNRALLQTSGLILYRGKAVYEALYHADCGGMTEDAASVWGSGIPELSHPDCPHPSRHWQHDLDRQGLKEKFITYFGLPKNSDMRSVQTEGRNSAGRVKGVRVDFSGGVFRRITAQEFRKIVGYTSVPSTNFQLSWIGGALRIVGLGQGHGVGLCQLGARALAEQGKGFREILKFYYPGTRLSSLSDPSHLNITSN